MTTAAGSGAFTGRYEGDQLTHVAFPLGGFGAGSLCVTGAGGFTHVALRHQPAMHHEPLMFAAVGFAGRPNLARVLEGPVPSHKIYGRPGTGLGLPGTSYGLPRFARAAFTGRFPFATVELSDNHLPLAVGLTAWSPFEPGDADGASLPVAGLEYRLRNTANAAIEVVFSFHVSAFLKTKDSPAAVQLAVDGFAVVNAGTPERPADAATLTVACDAPGATVDHAWFRGGWFDPLSRVWQSVREAGCPQRAPVADGPPAPGGSLYAPLSLGPGEERTVTVRLSWHAPRSTLRRGQPADEPLPAADDLSATYRPWYAAHYADAAAVAAHWRDSYAEYRRRSARFRDCLMDSTLPPEAIQAVMSNLSILKSPTVLRQADGRFWAWEGCDDQSGSCYGTCTHVWNYAQALAHLFPALERGVREYEHAEALDERGHQEFRTPLPIRPARHVMHAAADGQLGAVMKVHRDWRISGDLKWLRGLWPALRHSLDFAVSTWDPDDEGWLVEPQHNTYDVEFWGPNGMLTSCYLGALTAAVAMGHALGEDVKAFERRLPRVRQRLEEELFEKGRFIQRVIWKDVRAGNPADLYSLGGKYSAEAREMLEREGPKYQYGSGCLSDGIVGAWFAEVCGLGAILEPMKVASHLDSVHAHNFQRDLSAHANPQRSGYALGDEAGLLLCTWPAGGEPSLPFVYSNEVWTGIEYQVASHLILHGRVEAGLEIVRAVRARHDGRRRNPYDEYECGHWYARALSSYALLQAWSGARFDAVERVLHLAPAVPGDFRCFLAWDGGYGTVGVREDHPFLEVVAGRIPAHEIRYQPAPSNLS